MPRGNKAPCTQKQKRQAEHIEEGYEQRGVGKEEAERRAWATANKISGGGKKRGSGRGKKANEAPEMGIDFLKLPDDVPGGVRLSPTLAKRLP